ncbi:MAG: hypothetical protein SPK31_07460, partial [Alloprevotella sp.]|nr:hypothetical protein [Prevotellamassilia sp.]MDY5762922.1 hypothetical protein [Alloprevotella sp.]
MKKFFKKFKSRENMGTKLVQGERNGKKNLFLLTFPSRRLTCDEGESSARRAEWQEKLVFIDIPEPPPNLRRRR